MSWKLTSVTPGSRRCSFAHSGARESQAAKRTVSEGMDAGHVLRGGWGGEHECSRQELYHSAERTFAARCSCAYRSSSGSALLYTVMLVSST